MDYAYHRLARSWPKYRWWKSLVTGVIGVTFYVIMTFAIVIGFAVVAFVNPRAFDGFTSSMTTLDLDLSDPVTFTFAIGSIAVMLPALVFALLIMGPRPIGLVSSVAGRLRWGWLARCILPALAVYGVVFGASFAIDPLLGGAPVSASVTSAGLLLLVLALVLVPLQATAEEYVFRGYLMQTIGGWLKHPAWAILLPVPLFAIGHDYDIWGLLDVSIFAVFAGWLTWRTGGLEAAIVAHVVNNTALFALGSFDLIDINAADGSPIGLGMTLVTMVGYSALVLWQAKKTGLQTVRTVEAAPEPEQFAYAGGPGTGVGAAQPAYGPTPPQSTPERADDAPDASRPPTSPAPPTLGT
ncbi:CPBP family intramembrane glutamic endopeptidase [Marisediminicola sp. LYQ85]|uniref:CPBP family intramembrane glutamic endopeptidase n=1 Tax=Marisediminicola sp. LYQ85 TaxID=3391062 RepID=UPI003983D5BC